VDAQEQELRRTTEVSRNVNVLKKYRRVLLLARTKFTTELGLPSEAAGIQMAQF
jgi:hypothetical protein